MAEELTEQQHHRFNWGSFTFTNWNNNSSGFSSGSSAAGMPFVIGRDEHCNLRINHPYVSRNHARLTNSSQGLIIEDLGSSGGTIVRGVKVTRTAVTPGDSVIFSDKVQLDWNAQPLRTWLSGGMQSNRFQQQQHQNYRAPGPSNEHAYSYQPPVQNKQNASVWIASSVAAVFLLTFGVLIGTDTISLSDRTAEVQSSNSRITQTPPPAYSNHSSSNSENSSNSTSTANHTSSSNSSSTSGGIRYTGVQEGSNSSSNSSNSSNIGVAVDYATAIHQGDVIGLVELEIEHHGGQQVLEATGRAVEDAADGRYGATVQNATRAIDNFADDLTGNLTSGFDIGW